MSSRRTLHLSTAGEIAASFGLGDLQTEPFAAATGWGAHNTVWRFASNTGLWAVKEIGREPGRQIETAADLEAFAQRAGIPAPRPIKASDGGWLVAVDHRMFRCHEWVVGECPTTSLTSGDARMAGTALAQLHGLGLPCGNAWAADPHVWGETHWRDLADQAASAGLDWGPRLRHAIGSILKIEEAVTEYAATVTHRRVGSHCDVRPDNTLRTTTGLLLVDWDAAGPAIPGREVAQALRWWSPFEAEFVESYREVAGDVDLTDGAGEDGGLLWWLELNVRLALEQPDNFDRQQAARWLVEAVGHGEIDGS